MKWTELEPVTRTYCDTCGKDVTGSVHYGRGGKDYCCEHGRPTTRGIKKQYAIGEIRRQPFMVPNA